MRFVELTNGLNTFVTKEEQDLVRKINAKGLVEKKDLSEREQEVARRLTEKSILIRQKQNEQIYFRPRTQRTY